MKGSFFFLRESLLLFLPPSLALCHLLTLSEGEKENPVMMFIANHQRQTCKQGRQEPQCSPHAQHKQTVQPKVSKKLMLFICYHITSITECGPTLNSTLMNVAPENKYDR